MRIVHKSPSLFIKLFWMIHTFSLYKNVWNYFLLFKNNSCPRGKVNTLSTEIKIKEKKPYYLSDFTQIQFQNVTNTKFTPWKSSKFEKLFFKFEEIVLSYIVNYNSKKLWGKSFFLWLRMLQKNAKNMLSPNDNTQQIGSCRVLQFSHESIISNKSWGLICVILWTPSWRESANDAARLKISRG